MIFDIIKGILVDKLKVPATDITPEATLEDIDLDSLAAVELSLLLEKEFDVTVSEDELLKAGTVGGMVRLLDELSAATT